LSFPGKKKGKGGGDTLRKGEKKQTNPSFPFSPAAGVDRVGKKKKEKREGGEERGCLPAF